jgi:transposase
MENSITELLDLQDYRVLGVSRQQDGYELQVELPRQDKCPHCGKTTDRIHQHGRSPSRILWCFIGQRPVSIVITRCRLWCERPEFKMESEHPHESSWEMWERDIVN